MVVSLVMQFLTPDMIGRIASALGPVWLGSCRRSNGGLSPGWSVR